MKVTGEEINMVRDTLIGDCHEPLEASLSVAILDRMTKELSLSRARVAELERDNKGWEDECRLFMAQRDSYREALRQIAADGVARNALDPGPETRGERPLFAEIP